MILELPVFDITDFGESVRHTPAYPAVLGDIMRPFEDHGAQCTIRHLLEEGAKMGVEGREYVELPAGDFLAVVVMAVLVDAIDVAGQNLYYRNIAAEKLASHATGTFEPQGEDEVDQGEDCGESGENGSRTMRRQGMGEGLKSEQFTNCFFYENRECRLKWRGKAAFDAILPALASLLGISSGHHPETPSS